MMKSFISVPNLPDNKISLAAVGSYPQIISALHSIGINTVSFENKNLPEEVCRHQDMILCHTGGNTVFLDPSQDKAVLENKGFSVKYSCAAEKEYPEDVKLNIAVSDNFFICNKKTCDKALLNALEAAGKHPVYVNQGYTKCSVCFVTENAVITEDEGIYKALKAFGADTLLISKGDIYLSDNHYGFFGGSTGKIDKSTLAVTGSLSTHSDGEKIRDFCKKHGVEILELTQDRIIDVGGILPLKA